MSDFGFTLVKTFSIGFGIAELLFSIAIANKWSWLIKESYLSTNPDESPYKLRACLFFVVAMLAVIAERMKRP